MKTIVELTEALRCKLRTFGVPIDRPTSAFYENEAPCKNAVLPESILNKKHRSIVHHRCREATTVQATQVAKEGTLNELSDSFTKIVTAARKNCY